MLLATHFVRDVGSFFREIWLNVKDGILFLGGPLDIVVFVLDIVMTTMIFYFILKLFRDSRAWQLLRGILLIVAFALVASFLGLNTIGFMLNNSISILAIALVIIFQPELRRTLETVGRNRFGWLSGGRRPFDTGDPVVRKLIEAMVSACDYMGKNKVGALIIVERETKLGELQEQENAVALDAEVSAALLKQIFYEGSPLHDGAVLIRDCRVAAARIHVPLSDNYHLRKEFGTRHRAAVGASEIGDSIAVVVSEERGAISLAVDGRLYVLSDANALRTQLYRFLAPEVKAEEMSFWRRIGQLWGNLRGQVRTSAEDDETTAENTEVIAPGANVETETKQETKTFSLRNKMRDNKKKGKQLVSAGLSRRQQFALGVLAVVLAFFFWLYVQATVDPVIKKTYSVPLTYKGTEIAEKNGYAIQDYVLSNVQVTLKGRREVLERISATDLIAFVDVSQVEGLGLLDLPVEIDTQTLLYTRSEQILPMVVRVNVYAVEKP